MSLTVNDILLRDLKHLRDLQDENGDLITIEGIENIRLALLHRLVTRPGTLIHRPEYGVGIQDFLNAPNTIDNQRTIATRIAENFARDPRVAEVSAVSVEPNSNPELVRIIVKVRIIGRQEQSLEFIPFGQGIQV